MRLSLLTKMGVHMFLDDVLMLIVLVTGFVALLALGGDDKGQGRLHIGSVKGIWRRGANGGEPPEIQWIVGVWNRRSDGVFDGQPGRHACGDIVLQGP